MKPCSLCLLETMMSTIARCRRLWILVWLCTLAAACGAEDALGPELPTEQPGVQPPAPPPAPSGGAGTSANSYGRNEVVAEGTVTELPDGLRVQGTLHLGGGAGRVTFAEADLRVEYDASGRVRNITGTATVPSPHERISFSDPVQADVGLFSGAYLNRAGNLRIALRDDTDYFVYRVRRGFEMRVATGETGDDAVKPIVVRPIGGGEILLVVDHRDPMYYLHGAVDGLGDMGIGWSLHGRIPFTPWLPVAGLGTFEGRSTRTGTVPVLRILSVTGQVVDNRTTEVHFTQTDPWSTGFEAGYQSGFNGTVSLDLAVKSFMGIDLPLAHASGGVLAKAGTTSRPEAHAYVRGTMSDYSWWPTFLPVKPANTLAAKAFIVQSGDFAVDLEGAYGWHLPFGTYAMQGAFHLSPDSAGLTGTVTTGTDRLSVTSAVTKRATTLEIAPPAGVLNIVGNTVQKDVGEAIADAQKAWEDLEKATSSYEFELSLRGLRTSIPPMVDAAKSALSSGIASTLADHRNAVYYGSLRDQVNGTAAGYYAELNALKAAALDIRDNDATRAAIIRALRNVAARKTFSMTYRYKVFGQTIKTVNISRRILTDAQADRLGEAADNAPYIGMTSDRKVRMQQVYAEVDGREIFEKVRDDVENGLLRIPSISSFGFEILHDSGAFSVFAVIDGRRESMGQVNPFDVPAMGVALGKKAVEVVLR